MSMRRLVLTCTAVGVITATLLPAYAGATPRFGARSPSHRAADQRFSNDVRERLRDCVVDGSLPKRGLDAKLARDSWLEALKGVEGVKYLTRFVKGSHPSELELLGLALMQGIDLWELQDTIFAWGDARESVERVVHAELEELALREPARGLTRADEARRILRLFDHPELADMVEHSQWSMTLNQRLDAERAHRDNARSLRARAVEMFDITFSDRVVDAQELLLHRELIEYVRRRAAHLPTRQRLAFEAACKGMSLHEIAKEWGRRPDTVRDALEQAIEKIRGFVAALDTQAAVQLPFTRHADYAWRCVGSAALTRCT